MQRKIGALRLGLTFAGCFLGAGYVSGQELWQYFGAFGAHGLLGLVLAIALLGGTGVVLLRLSARTGIRAMDALIVRADIPWLRTLVGVLTAALLFAAVQFFPRGAALPGGDGVVGFFVILFVQSAAVTPPSACSRSHRRAPAACSASSPASLRRV